MFDGLAWKRGWVGLWQNPPFYAETDNFSGFCPFQNATSANPADCGLARIFLPGFTSPPNPYLFTGTLQAQNTNFKIGRVQQFNLNIERHLPGNARLTRGYAVARSAR